MGCCCTKTLRLCKPISTCGGVIDLNVLAGIDGVHKLLIDFLGVTFELSKTFLTGDNLEFPADDLNESHTFVAQMYGPDGGQMTLTVDDVVYDCIEFSTKINYQINADVT